MDAKEPGHVEDTGSKPVNRDVKDFYTERQKTWIDLDEAARIRFLNNGKGLILTSDRTGWKHLYHYDINGKLINAITTGKFTVTNLECVDEKGWYCLFFRQGPGEHGTERLL
jgi:dipeptidyl-peptidase-4